MSVSWTQGVGAGPEVVGSLQVAFADLSLGLSGPLIEGGRPSGFSAKCFSFPSLGQGFSFAFRGDWGWRVAHHVLGTQQHLLRLPRANFQPRASQVASGGPRKGQLV